MSLEDFVILVKQIFKISFFKLEEYQDKYYFQKKVREIFPQFSNEEIYSAIDNSLTKEVNLTKKDYISNVSRELYSIYKVKSSNEIVATE